MRNPGGHGMWVESDDCVVKAEKCAFSGSAVDVSQDLFVHVIFHFKNVFLIHDLAYNKYWYSCFCLFLFCLFCLVCFVFFFFHRV